MSDFFITFLASFLIWFMFAGLFILWFFRKDIKSRHVFHAITASFIAFLISQLIKLLFPTLRPFEITGEVPLTLTIPFDSTFPSSHSSAAFALAVSVQRYDKRVGFVFVLFAILVGLGRVMGNVHYYSDIFGGAIVGILSVIFYEKVYEKRLLDINCLW
jgi:undecaprenyl-diphosphatase